MKKLIVCMLLLLMSVPATAQEHELQSMPGYVDFGALDSVYGEPRVMINIGGFLLKFLAAASRHDPEAAALLQNLEGVRVNVYSTAGQMDAALQQIARVRGMLVAQSWEPIVQVREDGEAVQIFARMNETRMQGLVVMTANAEEAVFINILGEIDPAKLTVLMDQINADVDLSTEDTE